MPAERFEVSIHGVPASPRLPVLLVQLVHPRLVIALLVLEPVSKCQQRGLEPLDVRRGRRPVEPEEGRGRGQCGDLLAALRELCPLRAQEFLECPEFCTRRAVERTLGIDPPALRSFPTRLCLTQLGLEPPQRRALTSQVFFNLEKVAPGQPRREVLPLVGQPAERAQGSRVVVT